MFLEDLLKDHEKIRDLQSLLVNSLGRNMISEEIIGDLKRTIYPHIYFEEISLFPAIRNVANSSSINGLEVEHAGIWQLLDKIQSYIEGNDLTRATDRAEGLGRVLDTHYSKESEVVFGNLRSLEARKLNELETDFKKRVMPDGWICNVLRRYKH